MNVSLIENKPHFLVSDFYSKIICVVSFSSRKNIQDNEEWMRIYKNIIDFYLEKKSSKEKEDK